MRSSLAVGHRTPAAPGPGPTTEPATRRTTFATDDREMARERVSAVFAPYRMNVRGPRHLDFRLDVTPSPRLTLGRMRYGVATVNQAPAMENCYHVVLPMSGRNFVEQAGRRCAVAGGRSGFVLDPAHDLEVTWSADAWQRHVKIPKSVLNGYAAMLPGVPTGSAIAFDLAFDLRTPAGASLVRMVEYLDREFARADGIGCNTLASRELEGALVLQLLMTVPHQFTQSVETASDRRSRGPVDDVIDYVEGHLSEELTAADLARVAGVGVRTLQKWFQAAQGVSPLVYVRNARLDRVHAELTSGSGSVTESAVRWGFYHAGRFAQQYRERFGELPSETARLGHP